MDVDTRNPYVILGIPYGSDASTARKGFAAKSRLLKRGGSDVYESADLTWALHQIEQADSHDDSRLDVYRIPADPEATEHQGSGLFNPPPEPWQPEPARPVEEVLAELEAKALLEAHLAAIATQPPPLPDPTEEM